MRKAWCLTTQTIPTGQPNTASIPKMGTMSCSRMASVAESMAESRYNTSVVEAHLELETLRCPRCAGQLVMRVLADERGRSLFLTLDSACIACGVSPWESPDQRSIVFTPGASIATA